jgi:hypothetical protein
MKASDLFLGKRLFVGNGKPECLGRGPAEIRGSAYVEGPLVFGSPSVFPNVWATCMIGPVVNSDSPPAFIPGIIPACTPVNNSPYSLAVQGDAAILDNCDVNRNITLGGTLNAGGNIIALGEVMSRCGAHILSAKKNFDIPHPSKDGWRLRHTCVEAPYNDIYVRGRITNKTQIELPKYWKHFVDIQSISVQLQPIGSHQDVIVKRIDENFVYLQSKGGMPIDCYYHIYAERIDGEKLIPEYKGTSPSDYPGNNNEYSISGYHYDTKMEKK